MDNQMQSAYQPSLDVQQPVKKNNTAKILGVGCLVVIVIMIIVGALLWWGGKKAIQMGIEMTLQEMKTDVMANFERGTPEWEDAKYQMDLLILLGKHKKVGLIDFTTFSEKYETLKADGQIDRADAMILIDLARDFNDLHGSKLNK